MKHFFVESAAPPCRLSEHSMLEQAQEVLGLKVEDCGCLSALVGLQVVVVYLERGQCAYVRFQPNQAVEVFFPRSNHPEEGRLKC
jgi:hypothetical protein